jgi:hypothetical protein
LRVWLADNIRDPALLQVIQRSNWDERPPADFAAVILGLDGFVAGTHPCIPVCDNLRHAARI